jgi:hypothetical protein
VKIQVIARLELPLSPNLPSLIAVSASRRFCRRGAARPASAVLLDVGATQATLALADSQHLLLQEVEGSLSLCLASLQHLLTFADAAAAAPAASAASAPQDNGWLQPLVSSLETVLKTIQVRVCAFTLFMQRAAGV